MIKELLAKALFVVSVAAAITYGFLGVIAWADSQAVCPYGMQCDYAPGLIWMSAFIVPTGLLSAWLALRCLSRRK